MIRMGGDRAQQTSSKSGLGSGVGTALITEPLPLGVRVRAAGL